MSLKTLGIDGCSRLTDVTPLEGMELSELRFTPKNITKGMSTIRQMKSLKTIVVTGPDRIPAENFWKRYDAGDFK